MRTVSLSELWPLSQGVRDIMVLESFGYHRTLIGDHPVPCLTCQNRLSEADIIASNSLFLDHLVTRSYERPWHTSLLSWLMAKFTGT